MSAPHTCSADEISSLIRSSYPALTRREETAYAEPLITDRTGHLRYNDNLLFDIIALLRDR